MNDEAPQPLPHRLILETVSFVRSAFDNGNADIAMSILEHLETRLLNDELAVRGVVFRTDSILHH